MVRHELRRSKTCPELQSNQNVDCLAGRVSHKHSRRFHPLSAKSVGNNLGLYTAPNRSDISSMRCNYDKAPLGVTAKFILQGLLRVNDGHRGKVSERPL